MTAKRSTANFNVARECRFGEALPTSARSPHQASRLSKTLRAPSSACPDAEVLQAAHAPAHDEQPFWANGVPMRRHVVMFVRRDLRVLEIGIRGGVRVDGCERLAIAAA